MTQELIKAAQQACHCQTCRPITMEDMRMALCPTCGNKRCHHANDHRNACTNSNEPGQPGSAYPASALTQRPAAQEVDWRCPACGTHEVAVKLECHNSACRSYASAVTVHEGWKAPQQATPEPVALGPLAQRNIYDAIRSAYDLGYNDARNARTVPGDSAPGYKGRDVEADHGSALFNTLARRLRTSATPEPAGEPAAWRWFNSNGDQVTNWLDFKAAQKANVEEQVTEAGGRIEYAYTRPAPAPAVPEVDDLAQFIRQIDGKHSMGAGALADHICEWLAAAQAKGGAE